MWERLRCPDGLQPGRDLLRQVDTTSQGDTLPQVHLDQDTSGMNSFVRKAYHHLVSPHAIGCKENDVRSIAAQKTLTIFEKMVDFMDMYHSQLYFNFHLGENLSYIFDLLVTIFGGHSLLEIKPTMPKRLTMNDKRL